jgi:hypothetical protein
MMKKFLAIYIGMGGGPKKAAWDALDEATKKEREKAAMDAWGKWMGDHAAAIVDAGGPLGKTKRADDKGISDVKNEMAAYIIVQAESHEEAAKMFENHPHFALFPGDAVDIMPCIDMPKM